MKTKMFEQKGAVLPMIAIGLLAILGTAGLAIDLGHGYLNNSRLQNALDAAALSGARTLMITGKDTAAASVHARDAFDAHLNGEMSGLSSANMVIQYSRLLDPFTNDGTPDANFIRVAYDGFATRFSFASLLPGVGDSMNIASTAVAGPIPVGTDDGDICSLAPILMCGDPGPPDDPTATPLTYSQTDTNCGVFDPLVDPPGSGDYECYGYDVVPPGGANGDCHVLKSGSPGGMTNPTFNGVNCFEDNDGIGPGNFQLARIDPNCPGGDCVRQAMAGGQRSCSTAGASTIPSETGVTAGPSWQGLNTRFNLYQGGGTGGMLSPADYPPDRIINQTYWHTQYLAETAAQINSGFGQPLRRLITVPVVECDGTQNGQSNLPLLGFACFFLLEPLPAMGGGDIKGQLVLGCESGGSPGTNPGTSDPSAGPYQIILYKDPDSAET